MRLFDIEEWISELENKVYVIKVEQKKMLKEWGQFNYTNICITRIPEGEERKGQRTYLKT